MTVRLCASAHPHSTPPVLNYMIYPSLALFLGTGQATPDLPTVMMERLYTSPTYGMCASSCRARCR